MKGNSFKLFLGLAIVALALSACGLSSGGSSAALPTAVQPTQQAAQATSKYFQEDFNSTPANWSQFFVDGSKVAKGGVASLTQGGAGSVSVSVQSGFLVFNLGSNGQWAYSTFDAQQYDDVRVDASFENRGTNDNAVGLICRYDGTQWYEFDVANTGLYVIYEAAVQADKTVIYSKLADGGYSKYKTGKDTNILGITCNGRTLTLFINGNQLKTFDDNQYELKSGKIGVGVFSNVTPPTTVGVDYVKISQP